MDKRYIVIVAGLLILVLAGGGYFLWKTQPSQTPKPVAEAEVVSEQSANPYEETNPFSNIKVNPFE